MSKETLKRDPLSWIADSRPAGKSKQGKQSLQSKPRPQPQGSGPLPAVKSTRRGLKAGWTRATFIVREDVLEKFKSLAYWERQDLKDVVDRALSSYLKGKPESSSLKDKPAKPKP
jgi:hypothetical protein